MINKDDKVWKTFIAYQNLIVSQSKEIGLDLFGTDQATNMALSLTQSHFINKAEQTTGMLFASNSEVYGLLRKLVNAKL